MKALLVIAGLVAGILLAPLAPFNAGLLVVVCGVGAGLMFASIL